MGNTLVECLDCDTLFDPSPTGRGPRRERCEVHRPIRKAQLQRARTDMERARSWGVVAELVIAQEVFERDNWICHLCGEPVPPHLRKPQFRAGESEDLAPELEHVIPLSKGGPHTMDNCRASHSICNREKLNREGLGDKATPPAARTEDLDTADPPDNPCIVEGCGREAITKQMCGTHYSRNYRLGHPLNVKCGCGCGEIVIVDPQWTGIFYIDGHGIQYNAADPVEKLRRNLVPQPVTDRGRQLYYLFDDCLVWKGPQNDKGYGIINFRISKGKQDVQLVHRFAYETAFGAGSAVGLSIDHLCAVSLCCNPNHLEAVPLAENISRAALAITACPHGHVYDEQNTLYNPQGHRICRQCNRNRSHLRDFGHDFILDPNNPSAVRQRCLVCKTEYESTPQFCSYGHECTPENTLRVRGKRSCIQCGLNRRHVEQFDHEFVIDPSNTTKKHRCLVCVEAAPPVTHCLYGHEYSYLTVEYSRKGHRKCVQCRLNNDHVPKCGHEYAIDPSYTPESKRKCMVCEQKKRDEAPTHCISGHEFTPLTTEYHSTRGNRICVQCRLDTTHIPSYGHSFHIDPDKKPRRCLICLIDKETRNR